MEKKKYFNTQQDLTSKSSKKENCKHYDNRKEEMPMEARAVRTENLSSALLVKICKERLKTLDLKHCKALLEILKLLASAKIKTIARLEELLIESRPEAATSFYEELQTKTAEKQ